MNASRVSLFDVDVDVLTMNSLLDRIEEMIHTPGCALAYGFNAHSIQLAGCDPIFSETLRRSDIVYADGASILLAARLLRASLPEKLTTTDVWIEACRFAERKGYSFFLLGGEPGLAELTKRKTLDKYPGLKIVGTHHGYFGSQDDHVIASINAAHPDILWVGMGDPRQLLWAESVRRRLDAGIVITCGGLFKFVSGVVKRAPDFIHRNGFEWIYRIVREPFLWRRYAMDLPRLVLRILVVKALGKNRKIVQSNK
ncbi:MAG: WecB/TagA/CpsF family glycosyltransferase [Deltaproteobacteria bacterium]|nr:WecB/TagA/CpsF family glycosyltransferase [Deltaproteobacteria bacterium]